MFMGEDSFSLVLAERNVGTRTAPSRIELKCTSNFHLYCFVNQIVLRVGDGNYFNLV